MNAAEALRLRAHAALRPGADVAFLTEQFTYPKGDKPDCVLVAIARPGVCTVLAIDASEFDTAAQLDLAARCGFSEAPKPSRERPLLPLPR